MPTDENFSDYPETIGEIRSAREDRASNWTPRDMLINTLREVDKSDPVASAATHAILIFGHIDKDGATNLTVRRAGTSDAWQAMGMLHEAMAIMARP